MKKLLIGLVLGLALGGGVALAQTPRHAYFWNVEVPDDTPFTEPAIITLDDTLANGVIVGRVYDETANGYTPVKLFIRSDLVVLGGTGGN